MTNEKKDIRDLYEGNLRKALESLKADNKDNAREKNDVGFNRTDGPIADNLLKHKEWDDEYLETAFEIVKHYSKTQINGKLWKVITEQRKKIFGSSSGESEKESEISYRNRIAKEIQEANRFITLRESDTLYFFNPETGLYHEGATFLNELIRKVTGEKYSTAVLREVSAMVRVDTYIGTEDFRCPIEWINMINGAYNLSSGDFIQRTTRPDNEEEYKEWKKNQFEIFGKFNFTNAIPINYNEKVSCPKIDEFFHQVQNGDDNVQRMYEWFGYCLWKEYKIKRFAIFIGDHDTGKSTTAELLTLFLGNGSVSGLSMQAIMDDKFDRIKLYSKYANISGELSPQFIKDTSLLKELTGRDHISVRLMHSQKDFKFKNYAKLLFLANKIPSTYEMDDAYYNRVEIFEFGHKFVEGDTMNGDIMDEIATESELSGLFNESVKALRDLLKKGKFTASKTVEEKKDEYMIRASPFKVYIKYRYGFHWDDTSQHDTDDYIVKKSDMFEDSLLWCDLNNVPRWSMQQFFRLANAYFKEMGILSKRYSNNGSEYYAGIYMKEYVQKETDKENFDVFS